MVIHAPKPRPVEAGLWLFCDQTEELQELETGSESTARTRWPTGLDSYDRRVLAATTDALLDAAGGGRKALDRALRTRNPVDVPSPAAYWRHVAIAGSLGAQVRRRLNGVPVVVDDAVDGTALTQRAGGSGGSGHKGRDDKPGSSPGLVPDGGGGGGGGGSATSGASGTPGSQYRARAGSGGSAFAADDYVSALAANSWTATRGRGGSGGNGGNGGDDDDSSDEGGRGGGGGSGRSGIVRISVGDLILAENRNGSSGGNGRDGEDRFGTGAGGGGGGGGGGHVIAIAGGSVSGTCSCSGGSGGSDGNVGYGGGNGGRGGNGRVVLFYTDSQSVAVTSAVLTSYLLLPALPSGGLLVM